MEDEDDADGSDEDDDVDDVDDEDEESTSEGDENVFDASALETLDSDEWTSEGSEYKAEELDGEASMDDFIGKQRGSGMQQSAKFLKANGIAPVETRRAVVEDSVRFCARFLPNSVLLFQKGNAK